MVRFEKDKIVVEIESQFPADEWIEHVRDLVWAIGAINGELAEQERIYGLCQLVLELLKGAGEEKPASLTNGTETK